MTSARGYAQERSEGYDTLRALLADMAKEHREQLGKMLRERSLSYGEVDLSSGQTSDYYFDCKLTTLDPTGACLTGHAILDELERMGVSPDAIGGMSMGADPLVIAAGVVSELERRPMPGFLIRDKRKEHGKRKQIEGFDVSGRNVVIIDEVCTKGTSILDAIDAVKKMNAKVIGIISLVDREEGGSDELRRQGYNYHSIFTARELMEKERAHQAAAELPQRVRSFPRS